jgi:transposase
MNEEALRQLSKQELIVLFLEYQGETEARVRELEAKLEALTRPAKTPTNSSLPPSTGKKANLESGKRKVGRQQRRGKSRKRVEPDAVVECRVERCEQCGTDLSQERQRLVGKSQVVEIPPVQPVVVEAQRYGCQCPQCGKWQAAAHPEGMEPERVFGRRLEALVTYLHEMQHMSYQRLQTVLKTLLGLDISVGALVNVVLRVGRQLQPAAEAIREEIRGSAVVGSD